MIHLSEREQWTLTLSIQLSNAGHETAAQYLRDQITALAPIWRIEEEAQARLKQHVRPTNVFRVHRGSLPPHSAATPAVVQPVIRPDQTTA